MAKNTTYLTVASVIQKLISFGYYAYLADAIGSESLGKYTFALTFTSIFIIFMDFGLGPLLTREVARDENKLQHHFERIFSVKLVLIVLSLVALLATIHIAEPIFANITPEDIRLVYVGALIIVLDTLTFTCFSIFRALKALHWEAIGIVLYQAVIFSGGLTALHFGLPLTYVLGALLVGSAVQVTYMALLVKVRTKLKFRFRWSWKTARNLLAMAAPFAIAGVIFRLNGSADTVMLKVMVGDSHAGWYSLAFKLTFALTVLPGAFATSYFPVVSSYFSHAKEKLASALEQGLIYMLVLSAPIVAGVGILGDNIILAVWGQDWEASVMPLWIFMVGLPFVFLNYPIGNLLNAANRQKLNTLNMGIALLVNIALNAALIPYYTFNGAAVASVVSSVVLVALGLPWAWRIAHFRVSYLFQKTLRIATAAGLMAFVLYFTEANYPLVVLLGFGAVLYGAALLMLQGITRSELGQIRAAVLRKTAK